MAGFVSQYCEEAVEKLDPKKWQKVFFKIAKKEKDEYVRRCAVEKLEDQKLLARIAKNDKATSVRVAAYWKLGNQMNIADVAKNDEDECVRRYAVEKLDPEKWQDLLAKIAKNDKNKKCPK